MPHTLIQPYLFFQGRCEEAIAFYQQALGARLDMMMRYSESPDPPPPGMLPPGFENKVMHATLHVNDAVLMASDGDGTTPRFEGFRLSLAYPTEAEAQKAFSALAAGGLVVLPLGKTFWSPCFGMVDDRFGVGWMVSTVSPPPN